MTHRTKTPFILGMEYVREHPQLITTLLLVILIPVAFLISGQQFLEASRENQERLEKDRIGMMHDLLASLLVVSDFEAGALQHELEKLASRNPDITTFQIAREDGDSVTIVASLVPEEINTRTSDPALYRMSNIQPGETFIRPYAFGGTRFWDSATVIRTESFPDYYIVTQTSLAHIDALFAARIMHAYYWLAGLLGVILFLLFRHVRLIDYSYLYREMKKANEMKDLFTNMIAHELRAPLTAMRGYASMIRERDGVDSETRKNALEVESAAGRLVTIVSDLLDVARIQSGKLHMEQGTVHVSGITRSIVEALFPSANEKHIELTVEDPVGTLTIQGDEKRFYQILTNVVSNAIKYTKKGAITIELTEAVDRIEIRVKDTGMGISSENQKKMFAPFFRVEGEETATITGTGLGMWVTKQLVELMSGSIGIESIKGIGTHVVITFPKNSSEKS